MRDKEIVLEERVCNHAARYGYKNYKLAFPGTNGAPDRIFGRNGKSILIEFKREGEEPTKQQYKRHRELREDFGLTVYWTDNFETACAYLGIPTT